MTKYFSQSIRLAVAGTAALLFSGGTMAATCTAMYTATTPDPFATLTHSTSCGPGSLATNDTDAEVRAAEPSAALWTQIDKDEAAGSGGTGVLRSSPVAAGSSGEWGIDTSLTAFNSFLIVIKDGNAGTPSAPVPTWYWFVVDTAAGCASATVGFAGLPYCGTWSMYGEAGKIKNISHMTLYGATVSTGGTPGTATPEPGSVSMALLGLALVGGGFAIRRRRQGS